MAHIIIDRRKNDKGKSTDNRRRFVKRVKDQVKDAVKDVIRSGSIKDMLSNKGKKISIPGKGLSKPTFGHSREGGIKDRVYPGNDRFISGDRIKRPESGGGGKGKKASPDGQDEDQFKFTLTREEFLDIFFEDLELPDMVQKQITKIDEYINRRAGFSVDGTPSRLNIMRSMKQAKGRRFALRSPKKRKLKKLEEELALLEDSLVVYRLGTNPSTIPQEEVEQRIQELKQQIAALKRKIKAIPFIDDVDLRYNRWERVPVPTTQAVMFGIMDVSGSMGEWEKEMAKRFFMLLLLFLDYNYERVDIVWIRHHSIAAEVDEDEFFYSQESGGTLVSPALQLMNEIIADRYPPSQWNIFGCQISDGDNWPGDNPAALKLLDDSILPQSRYFAYVEIDQMGGKDSDLWADYELLKQHNQNLEMTVITSPADIYPVFRSLFEKRKA
jgi:uncharacterized sporulation protein YeaH/YhbH (DUF444 family)